MRRIGLGIIGLGYVGKIHLQHSLRLNNASLVGVSDVSRKALNAAKETGIRKTFTDYEQLLKDPEVEAVVIALPTHLHLECARKATEAKKHILLEKPIARNVIEAREIISAAQRNSVKLMMSYPLRFNREFSKLREEIESGTLGSVEIAQATYVSSGPFFHRMDSHAPVSVPEWWFKKELTGGGALIDIGIHLINLLRWYFGEIKEIKSLLGYRFNMDLEDSATCLTKFELGTKAIITVGWFSQRPFLEIGLHGTVNHATAGRTSQNRLLTAVQMLTTGTSRFFQSHFAELQYFANCLARDQLPSPSGKDGLKDLEAISMAYENRISLD